MQSANRQRIGAASVAIILAWAASPALAQAPSDAKAAGDVVSRAEIGLMIMSAIGRVPRSNAQDARDRGMIPTGLVPKFDDRVNCFDIDDTWAQDYGARRGRDAMHGGIDIPAPRGTPILAIAAGEVVAKFLHEDSADGIQIWLRHSPDDTGLPVWTYSQYAHLRELPELPIGARVRMGDPIGNTSNTGISGAEARTGGASRNMLSKERRDAVHFAVVYSTSRQYFRDDRRLIPKDGWWMDPNAIYRKAPPFDSVSMKALPSEQKQVPIPYTLADGTKVPADTKLIWPYACLPKSQPLPSVRRNPPER